jgi:hypothetical protein
MKVAAKIQSEVDSIQPGRVFRYSDLGLLRNEYFSAAKALSRLVKEKRLKRLSNGVFFKPKPSVFGELGPNERERLRPYLFDGRKRIAYVTGSALFNRLNLTTQIPKDIDLSSKTKRPSLKIGNRKVRFVKSYADINDKNYRLLEILDALKDFKKIPDINRESAITRIKSIIKELTNREKKDLIKYALSYPPRVRAFLGALLECINIDPKESFVALKQSLNPLSSYAVGVPKNVLPNAENWSIT